MDGFSVLEFSMRKYIYVCIFYILFYIFFSYFFISVRPSLEPGWLEGCLDGKRGLVPENYVEFLN